MTRARTADTHTNGTSGIEIYSAGPSESPVETRKIVAVLLLSGAVSEARTLYLTIPGATGEGWNYLERATVPLRSYVLEGDPTWIKPLALAEHQGVKTPAGDCAEDALPLADRNPYRAAAKMTNGATHDAAET